MNIYLMGYRGSGKSTVAPALAKHFGWPSVDTDEQVELLAGCSITEIFEQYGEPTFRDWETSVLLGLAAKSDQVVSLGGGVPLAAENRDTLKRSGITVWLTASADVLWNRISKDDKSATTRPQLTNQSGLEEVRELLAARTGIYAACADYRIETDDLSPEQIAEKIANWWDPVDK